MNINQIIEQHELWLKTDGKEGSRAILDGADLRLSDLRGADLRGADLYYANLYCADLYYADLRGAKLYYANIRGANLTRASLIGADLRGADLTRADLYYADLRGADLRGADLTRADLYYADLRGADLRGANLTRASGNLNHLKSVFCETYPVTYTAEVMQIGCERHTLEDWWSFDDARIIKMDGNIALKWWRTWKPILQQIIAVSPAIATGYVANNTDESDAS